MVAPRVHEAMRQRLPSAKARLVVYKALQLTHPFMTENHT